MAAVCKEIGKRWLLSIARSHPSRSFSSTGLRLNKDGFDEAWLEVLVCPLSKAPLRYCAERQELVCEELAVAYPIINGIPNLVPTDARKLNSNSSSSEPHT